MSNKVTLNMLTRPNSAAQFKAYMAFENWIAESIFSDETCFTDVTINITAIFYHKPSKNQQAIWDFSGTIEYREYRDTDFNGMWINMGMSAFCKGVSKREVTQFIDRKFK